MELVFYTLVLSLPTRNSTLRMRVWRALKECGAVVLRDGVYLLPTDAPNPAALVELEKEIRSHGGFAVILEATPRGADDEAALRAKIGLAGQYAAVDENLTGFENLEMVGRLYHLGKEPARERAESIGIVGAGPAPPPPSPIRSPAPARRWSRPPTGSTISRPTSPARCGATGSGP